MVMEESNLRLCVAIVCITGCGGLVESPADAADATMDADAATACPATLPTGPCPLRDLVCSYSAPCDGGTATTQMRCTDTPPRWVEEGRGPCRSSESCPEEPPGAGSSCARLNEVCRYWRCADTDTPKRSEVLQCVFDSTGMATVWTRLVLECD